MMDGVVRRTTVDEIGGGRRYRVMDSGERMAAGTAVGSGLLTEPVADACAYK